MSGQNQVSVRDLVEEAKKRIVLLGICVVGLSYLMSLTSSSVWVNLPAAATLIVIIRYLSLDFDMRKKAAAYSSKPSSESSNFRKKSTEYRKVVQKFEWRRKVNSPVVEDAIDHFTRHLVSEWVTDLWYSRLTPDTEGPEELVNIMNGALGQIAGRFKNINLIDLLTRDLINLICSHLEHFRSTQAKIENRLLGSLTIEERDMELRRLLAAEEKLHPAMFSAEAQHKVLQHLMDGLISFTFKPEDLRCLYFRYTARELLASAVMRPVLNLASPRFINERIESIVINMTKAKEVHTVNEASQSKPDGSSRISSDHFSRFLDPSVTGVELVRLNNGQSKATSDKASIDNRNGNLSKDPLLSIDTRSTRSWSSEEGIQRHNSGGQWGEKLELFSRRKTKALAPEHFDNMWTKGRDYRKKDVENRINDHVQQSALAGKSVIVSNVKTNSNEKDIVKCNATQSTSSTVQAGCTAPFRVENQFCSSDLRTSKDSSIMYWEDDEHNLMRLEESESGSNTSYTSEDEDSSNVTGLDSPGTKVWDGRSKRNTGIQRIHHPLEHAHISKKRGKGPNCYQRILRTQSGRKRSRPSNQKLHVWQEVERTSFLSGDGQDILNSLKGLENAEASSDDSEVESLSRVHSGAAASSSASGTHSLTISSLKNSLAVNSFFKLKCEVLGANIVKSGSRTFAVYSISVTDANNNSWSIKRRFRHFEELHHRLKEFPEYNLHLPPKHFLSTGLDVLVIKERCKLLDDYLKKLMQFPTVSGSIEVWDFLSVDSQTYVFSNSFSILETLSVDLDGKPSENSRKVSNSSGHGISPSLGKEHIGTESKPSQMKNNFQAHDSRLSNKGLSLSPAKNPDMTMQNPSSLRNSGMTAKRREDEKVADASELLLDAATDPTLPTEWVPPNLSVPILDLVDVIFQLQDGGWIRRKAFWVAKQVLQLGMGDAFDDWLLEKIQLLRKGSVVASAIKRLEQILWPDGIFISKHPKRRPQPVNTSQSSPSGREPADVSSPGMVDEQQQQEADRRAKFVYELMIDNAPAAIVGLVGRREYEQCAKDLYFFLQSNVCVKQLAFDLIELVLLSAFPELDFTFKQLHEEKSKFGEFKAEY